MLSIQSFNPSSRVLMGPGPSNVYPNVLSALSKKTLGHLDPEFLKMMDEIKVMLQYVMQTNNRLTFVVSAPASAAMEASFVNILEPGDKVIVCKNGIFGNRMVENALRCGAEPIIVEDKWGEPVDVEKVAHALRKSNNVKAVALVHAETSTGVLSDVASITQLAKQYGALSIVDAVTSVGGVPFKMDDWGIDVAYTGSQKCLSCIPGLSPISFSEKAIDVINKRSTKIQSWFLDASLIMHYWLTDVNKSRAYHHTAPVNSLYALHEALVTACNLGLEKLWSSHQVNQQYLITTLSNLGLELFIQEKYRLPQLTVVKVPTGINDQNFRKELLEKYSIEIGAGLGELAGKVWRIGTMGYSGNKENIDQLNTALNELL